MLLLRLQQFRCNNWKPDKLSKHASVCVWLPRWPSRKESACNAGNTGSIPGLGSSPGGGNGNPLQYSCLENSHGQRSLAGYSPWTCKELDMTEQLSVCVCVCVCACTQTTSRRRGKHRKESISSNCILSSNYSQ